MSYENEVRSLEHEWSPEHGFFWRIRQGHFDVDSLERVRRVLSSISIQEETDIPRRLVSLLWYIPIFMQWQIDRVKERGADELAYIESITAITNEVERLLGVP